MIVREYIDIKRGIDVQPALNIGDRGHNDSRGTLLKNLLGTFHFLDYKSMQGYDERMEKEMDITLEYRYKKFQDLAVIKELKKWFKNFTNYDVDIHMESSQGQKQFKIEVYK